jgi:hypothetical protein
LDKKELENWKKIKEFMEQSGNTDNMFYKRSLEILKTGKDPLSKFLGDDGKGRT